MEARVSATQDQAQNQKLTGSVVQSRRASRSDLSSFSCDQLTDFSEAESYVDDQLTERLTTDYSKDISDCLGVGWHLKVMRKGNIVGIFTFTIFNDCTLEIHPRINRRNMIYAERCCNMAINYAVENTKAKNIIAMIPSIYKNNARMAERCGFMRTGVLPNCHRKNGKFCDLISYVRAI